MLIYGLQTVMTIEFGGGGADGRFGGFLNIGPVSDSYTSSLDLNSTNMMRPMPFSGYPFQGIMQPVWTKYFMKYSTE